MAKKLSPMEQRASSKVLGDLRKSMQGSMKGKMDNLKKVTVASDSKEGLKKGLDLAKKVLPVIKDEGDSDSQFDDLESSEEEASESPAEEASESPEEESTEVTDGSEISPEEEEMTAEQLDNHIKALQQLKFKKQ